MIINEAWDALRREMRTEPGWHVRRVHDKTSLVMFAGIRQPGSAPGLLLELSVDDIPAGLSLPSSKGFQLETIMLGRREQGRIRFALVLTEKAYEGVFGVLCEDTAQAAVASRNVRDAIRTWINRLYVWQEFMARHGAQGLSEWAVLGVFGELLIMRDYLIPAVGIPPALQAWTGPLGEPNDFALPNGFLEVKTTSRQAPELIEISNADQLDDTRGTILLAHVNLRPDESGESLPHLISCIRSSVAQEEPTHLELLEKRLMSAGYIDGHADLYTTSFSLQSVTLFHVSGRFPRLRRSDIPAGIRKAIYSVELQACSSYEVSMQDLQKISREHTT